jgi:phage-related protein
VIVLVSCGLVKRLLTTDQVRYALELHGAPDTEESDELGLHTAAITAAFQSMLPAKGATSGFVWLHGIVKTPPFSREARVETGYLPRMLQAGEKLSMPHSRPLPAIGPRCHELRVNDEKATWRIIYRIDEDAIVILEVFDTRARQTSPSVIAVCRQRSRDYDSQMRRCRHEQGKTPAPGGKGLEGRQC